MARAHIEFIQSQKVAWQPGAALGLDRRVRVKTLGQDPQDGAWTALVDVPPGEALPAAETLAASEEWFVLRGAVAFAVPAAGGTGADKEFHLARHHYAYLPAGTTLGALRSPEGARLLVFRNAPPAAGVASGLGKGTRDATDDLMVVDAPAMPWDATVLDPKLLHLRMSRKILRAAADGSCRTYLLAGLPHGRPADGRAGLERHPHAEEMFLLSGDLAGPQGVMHPGAYFYRPRDILHGPHFSDLGFLMFMRNPGTNSIVTEWTAEKQGLAEAPPYAPILPPDSPAAWAEPYHRDTDF